MEIKTIEFVNGHISEEHDHDICFRSAELVDGQFVFSRLEALGSAPSYYVGFAGDPIINYTFGSTTTTEAKRLKNLTANNGVDKVTASNGSIIVNANFNTTPVNVLIDHGSDWVSADVPYTITTFKTECKISRYVLDHQTSNIINVKYCILDQGSISLSSENMHAIAIHGDVSINNVTSINQPVHYLQGPATLSSSSKGYVFVVEYTD